MHALSVHPARISQYLRNNFISTSVTSKTLGLHESGMSWSGQAHVMNNMYGSSYNSNMSSAAAATHGAFFRYMRHPTVKQENNKYKEKRVSTNNDHYFGVLSTPKVATKLIFPAIRSFCIGNSIF